ncbi:TPA: AarF/ABC1/UbiB kinase family protein [Candidatus Woesearchaeota archaeon]|nr:AarF/ABC1/UbiB kinase family protein [Candidatus Woesearchaeota archaeon]
MPLFNLIQDIKDINRLREILAVLFEEGFGYWISRTALASHVPWYRRIFAGIKNKSTEELTLPVRVRRAMERLGPTFVKLGQILSLRPDFVPKEYIKEFEKMQDHVPEFSYEEAKQTVEHELGKSLKSVFKSFDKKPIASASLSQVHKAVLKNGKIVAVKIQRPNIRAVIEKDIRLMLHIASILEEHFPEAKKIHAAKIVEEFARWTEQEIDFRNEAKNAIRFRQNFLNNNHVVIPKVYNEYTTGKLLVLEFLDGTELNQIGTLEHAKNKYDVPTIVKYGFQGILEQVFVHGFFHADPHPGNIFIMKNGKIGLVDFGIVGHFNENLKNKSIALFTGIIEGDSARIIKTFLEMGMNIEQVNYDAFKDDLEQILAEMKDTSVSDVKISYILDDILNLALKHNVRMPVDFVLFGKTIATLEGVALKYDPDFKIIESSKPLIRKLAHKKFSVREHALNIYRTYSSFKESIKNIPIYTLEIMNKIREGKIKIDIADTDIKTLSLEMEHSSGNIAFGMIIAALFVTSGLMLQSDKLPVYNGYPIVPIVGIGLGFILTLWLLHRTLLARYLN